MITAVEWHHHFTVKPNKAVWAGEHTDSATYQLTLVLALKCFARMGRFPGLAQIPAPVVDVVRRSLALPADMTPEYAMDHIERTHAEWTTARHTVDDSALS
jgi:hypothetical protein